MMVEMTLVSSSEGPNLCTEQKDGRSDALSEVMLHSEQGLGFYMSHSCSFEHCMGGVQREW